VFSIAPTLAQGFFVKVSWPVTMWSHSYRALGLMLCHEATILLSLKNPV
jgi:hypothetical protein